MGETPTQLHYKTIAEIAELVKSKQLSPVEITTDLIERIDQLDCHLNSYATIMRDDAIAAAKKSEAEIVSGMYRGPCTETRLVPLQASFLT